LHHARRGQLLPARGFRWRDRRGDPRFSEGDRAEPQVRRSLPLAGTGSAQSQQKWRSQKGVLEIVGVESESGLDPAADREDPSQLMRERLAVGGAIAALTLLSYFQFPGHTYLQADTQI